MSDTGNPRDEQYEAEITDPDEIDVLDFPPDRPMGVGDLLAADVPAAGDYAPDDLRRRDLRLTADVARADEPERTDRVSRPLTDPGDPDVLDLDAQLVGGWGGADWDVADPGAALSDSSAAGHRPTDSWPAEEAALHVIDDQAPAEDPLPTLGAARAGIAPDTRGRRR